MTALATNFAVDPPEVVFSETGAGGSEFTTVPAGAITSIGSQRAMIFRQVVGHRRENGLIARAESRMVGQVDALFGLRAAAGEVEQQALAFFLESHMDFPGIARMDGSRLAPVPVGNLGDSFSQDRFGIMQHLL